MKANLLIENITIYKGKIQTDLRFSSGVVNFFPFTIIELQSGPFRGVGEAGCHSGLCERVCRDILGKNASSLEGILPEYLNHKECFPLREGFAIALYDLAGHAYEIPFHVLLGGKRRNRVPLMPVIFSHNPREAGQKAARFAEQGYRYLKVKFIGDIKEDAAILHAIRKETGAEFYVQADVNRGYKTYSAAKEALLMFAEERLTVAEDILEGSLSEYHQLRSETDIMIMIDQDARSLKDIGLIIKEESADIINEHPHCLGGVETFLKIHAAAQSAGISTCIGGTGSLGIVTAAAQTLSSVICLDFPCGELCGVVDLGFEYKLVRHLYPVVNGEAVIPDEAGLGVEIDPASLAKFTEEKSRFSI